VFMRIPVTTNGGHAPTDDRRPQSCPGRGATPGPQPRRERNAVADRRHGGVIDSERRRRRTDGTRRHDFDFDARTDSFSAVNAYVHCDDLPASSKYGSELPHRAE